MSGPTRRLTEQEITRLRPMLQQKVQEMKQEHHLMPSDGIGWMIVAMCQKMHIEQLEQQLEAVRRIVNATNQGS